MAHIFVQFVWVNFHRKLLFDQFVLFFSDEGNLFMAYSCIHCITETITTIFPLGNVFCIEEV